MKKILVLDDDAAILALVENFLGKDYQIIKTSTAEDALKVILKEMPDLLLMDVLMPDISGYAFRKILSNFRAKIGDVPVIAMSSNKNMRDFFGAAELHEFIHKPFQREQLQNLIGQFFHDQVLGQKTAEIPAAPTMAAVPKLDGIGGKWAVVITPDAFVARTLKSHLEEQGYQVEVAIDEKDFSNQVVRLEPMLVICQFWETAEILDGAEIYKKFKTASKSSETLFAMICIPGLEIEASKTVPINSVVVFNSSEELRRGINGFLEGHLKATKK